MIIFVKVIPNAPKNLWVGKEGDVLKIKIKAQPQEGKANEMLIEFLAETFKIPKKKIRILSGETSRLKKVEIDATVTLPL